MRPARITAAVVVFAATVGMLALLAAPASAAPRRLSVAVHASPNPVAAGHRVTLSGSVGPEAAGSDCSSLILYSDAFDPANREGYGIAVYTTAKPSGAFAATTTIPRSKTAGIFPVYLRCGGATVGGGPLVVRAAPTTPPANVQVSPRSVAAGDTVTVSGSVGPDAAGSACASSVALLSKAFVHAHDFAGVPAVFAAVKPGGAFAAATTIPRSKPAGTYAITGRCGGGNFGGATLVVRAAAPPTTTPVPTPPASGPSVVQPAVAAPAASGPPTPPASPTASRWMVPWLAALGSGTLAALGAWLWYRRQHPASLSPRGRSRMAN